MANINRVVLVGNLTKDPELRQTPSGTSCPEIVMDVMKEALILRATSSASSQAAASSSRTCASVTGWYRLPRASAPSPRRVPSRQGKNTGSGMGSAGPGRTEDVFKVSPKGVFMVRTGTIKGLPDRHVFINQLTC